MHKLKVTKKIGKNDIEITVEGDQPKELIKEVGKWSFPGVSKCGICGKDNLELQHRQTQDDFSYNYVKCLDCGAELTFGEKKKGGVIYFRTNDNGSYAWNKLDKK